MPTAVEHDISINVDPFAFHERVPDVSLSITGLHLPDAAVGGHDHTSDAATINFARTNDALTLHIELLVPAVHPTDFLLG